MVLDLTQCIIQLNKFISYERRKRNEKSSEEDK